MTKDDKQFITNLFQSADRKLDEVKNSLKEDMLTMNGNLREEMITLNGNLREDMLTMNGNLREEMITLNGNLREEMRTLNGNLREEMKTEMKSMKAELKDEILRNGIMIEQIQDDLRLIRDDQIGANRRIKNLETLLQIT